jgi:hypothetical protein
MFIRVLEFARYAIYLAVVFLVVDPEIEDS